MVVTLDRPALATGILAQEISRVSSANSVCTGNSSYIMQDWARVTDRLQICYISTRFKNNKNCPKKTYIHSSNAIYTLLIKFTVTIADTTIPPC